MSGHNKWSTIKHKKGAADAKRGKIFTKIIKEISVAARLGGGDPDANPRLRLAIANARGQNMPKDNIERAIKKGTGELEGTEYTECVFEGYGPNGVAILVEGMTDNINRTSSEVRSILSKNNGNLGAQGSVVWMFDKTGLIMIDKKEAEEEKLFDIGSNAGADDIVEFEEHWEVVSNPDAFEGVRQALETASIPMASAEITLIPKTTVALAAEDAKKVLSLIEKLEENDDVQKVHGNFEIAEEVMKEIS